MDPVSQGALGAAFAQGISGREKLIAAAWLGCAAGMAPDLDIFIQSTADPLLFLEYHRHFTHALAFIPVGALIVAGVLFPLARRRLSWRETYLTCFIAYATHGLLDACTSYGTQLFWPFSSYRVAWNNVSVVDPLFTLPLLALVITAARTRRRLFAWWGMGWAVFYLLLGAAQLYRATDVATALASARGHTPQRLTLKPGFANLLLWKSIYEFDGSYYVDAVRVGSSGAVCPGERVPRLSIPKHLPFLDPASQQALDLARFRWFSDDYLSPLSGGRVTDIRYSMVPNETLPLWGITLDPRAAPTDYVVWWANRTAGSAQRTKLWQMLWGEGCKAVTDSAA